MKHLIWKKRGKGSWGNLPSHYSILYVTALHPNAEKLFGVTSNLHEVCNRLNVCGNVEKPRIKIFSHVKPMLLERLKIEEVGKLFQGQSLEYFVQIKYDGERSQIHMEDGKFKYFTRNGYDRHTHNAGFGKSCTSGEFSIL